MPFNAGKEYINRIESLIKEKKTFIEIQEICLKEFEKKPSTRTLSKYNKKFKESQGLISEEIKNAIQDLYNLYSEAMNITEFQSLINEKIIKSVETIEGLL